MRGRPGVYVLLDGSYLQSVATKGVFAHGLVVKAQDVVLRWISVSDSLVLHPSTAP